MMCRISLSSVFIVLLASLFLPSTADATITSEGPFTGNLTETWESFDNSNFNLPDPTVIMGGAATISSASMIIYEPSTHPTFGVGTSGFAQVSDGLKAIGLDGLAQTATISFVNPVYDIGAYWGAATPPDPAMVTLNFSDGSSTSFTYEQPFTGVLDWHGWHSTIGINSVSYSGDYVVMDGLQANTSPVPEPSTFIAGALLAIPFGWQTIRRRRNYKHLAR